MLIKANSNQLTDLGYQLYKSRTPKPFQLISGTAIENTIEKTSMKTTTKYALIGIALALIFQAKSQHNHVNSGPKTGTFVPHSQPKGSAPYQGNGNVTNSHLNHWVAGNNGWGSNYGSYGNVTIGFGTYPCNPFPQQGYYYGNGLGLKKSARYAIRSAGYIIGDAVGYHDWHDIYSPLLAKAIRHYNYSRQLYRWGNYNAAVNHAERAHYLAWFSLQYYQNPDYYQDGFGQNEYNQPDPYSDPFNPYYKKSNPNGKQLPEQDAKGKRNQLSKEESIDLSLPVNELDDKTTISTFDKTLLKDE